MISYKYNIYHSKKTKYLDKMLRECCFVWNHALALQRRYYRLFGKYIPVGKMQKHFAKRVKRILLHSQTVQEILQRLDSAYNPYPLPSANPKFDSTRSLPLPVMLAIVARSSSSLVLPVTVHAWSGKSQG